MSEPEESQTVSSLRNLIPKLNYGYFLVLSAEFMFTLKESISFFLTFIVLPKRQHRHHC